MVGRTSHCVFDRLAQQIKIKYVIIVHITCDFKNFTDDNVKILISLPQYRFQISSSPLQYHSKDMRSRQLISALFHFGINVLLLAIVSTLYQYSKVSF